MMMFLLVLIGALGILGLIYAAFIGPNANKAYKRRLETMKDPDGHVIAGHAQAHSRILIAARESRSEGWAAPGRPKRCPAGRSRPAVRSRP